MNDVKFYQRYGYYLSLLLVTLTTACAPVKTLDVWQDEAYSQPLQKTLVVVVAHQDNIRKQFENVLADQLAKRGVDAIPSNKVLSQPIAELDRETVLAKVRELGISNVLVSRSIDKKEITNHQYGGVFYGGVAIYDEGWHTFAYGSFYDKQYDTEYFTIATKLFAVGNKRPVWADLSQVKVEGSRQGAVNEFVPVLVKQLENSQLLEQLPN
jgi:hypothetical protein